MKLTTQQKETLMRAALAAARQGMADGEVPIGAVIARYKNGDPQIVAEGYNRVNSLRRRTAHAEIVTFENAGGGSDGRNEPALPLDADDAILVSTLEPCVMCLGAAMEAGIKTVLFGLAAPADNGTQRVKPPESPESASPEIEGDILADESQKLFEEWLRSNQNTEQAKFVKQLLALVGGDSDKNG